MAVDKPWIYPSTHKPPYLIQRFNNPNRRYATGLHKGVDLRAFTGDAIVSATGGQIIVASFGKMYGNQVWVQTELEETTFKLVYAHLSKFATGIKVGKTVMPGDILGYAGSTGNSDAAHLHFGIKVNGKWVDPMQYIQLPKG